MAKKIGMLEDFCNEIHFSPQLHDIGKMSVNSAIPTKRGRLDDDECFEMNQHTTSTPWNVLTVCRWPLRSPARTMSNGTARAIRTA